MLGARDSKLRNSLPSGSSQSSGRDRKINIDTPSGKCHKRSVHNALMGQRKSLTTSGCVGCDDRDGSRLGRRLWRGGLSCIKSGWMGEKKDHQKTRRGGASAKIRLMWGAARPREH